MAKKSRKAARKARPERSSSPGSAGAPPYEPHAGDLRRLAALEPSLPTDDHSKALLHDLIGGNWQWLAELCRIQLRARALLLDQRALVSQAIRRMVAGIQSFEKGKPLEAWIHERITDAMDDLIRADREEAHRADADESAELPQNRHRFLSEALGLEPRFTLRACVAFNIQPLKARRVFYEIAVLGTPLDRFLLEHRTTRQAVRTHLKSVLRAISILDDEDEEAEDSEDPEGAKNPEGAEGAEGTEDRRVIASGTDAPPSESPSAEASDDDPTDA